MYKITNLYEKPKSKNITNSNSSEVHLVESEVRRVMGKYYDNFVNSKEEIYETIG